MTDILMGNNFLVLLVLTFVAILLLLESAYLAWKSYRGPEARRINDRVRSISAAAEPTSVLRHRATAVGSPIDRIVQRIPHLREVHRVLLQADLPWTVSGLVACTMALFVFGTLAVAEVLHQPLWLSASVGLLAATAPAMYLMWRRERRLARIERQLPDALDLIVRALRAGHAFTAGLKMAGEEMPQPIAGEFRAVHEEINFGVSLQQALTHLSERVPLTDLRYFTVAVLIQRESGGNLTEILSDLSRLIRERGKLLSRIRVLSAEGRLSAWILAIMPFALGGLILAFNPDFMRPLFDDPIGHTLLRVMAVLMVLGGLMLRKISRIRV